MLCSYDGQNLKRKYAVLKCESCAKEVHCCLGCVVERESCPTCEPDVKRAKKEHTFAHVHEQVATVGYCFLPEHTAEYGPHEWYVSKDEILERKVQLNLTFVANHKRGEDYPRVGKLVSREFTTNLGADADEIAVKFDEWVARDGPNKNHLWRTLTLDDQGDLFKGPYTLLVFLVDNEARVASHVEKLGYGFSKFENKQFNVAAVTVVNKECKSDVAVPQEVALAAVNHALTFLRGSSETFFAHWK